MLKAIKAWIGRTESQAAEAPAKAAEPADIAVSAAALKQEADALFNQGKLDLAAQRYQAALVADPGLLRARCNLGIVLHALGRADEAAGHLRLAIDGGIAALGIPLAHHTLGLLERGAGSHDEACRLFLAALVISPAHEESATALCDMAARLAESGELARAQALLEQALSSAPPAAPAGGHFHHFLGNVLRQKGEANAALGHYRLALEARPDDPQAHYNLGGLLQDQGELDAAIAHYAIAAAKPGFTEARWALALATLLSGDLGKGFQMFEMRLDADGIEGLKGTATVMRTLAGKPRWRGEDLRGKTLLVWLEHGIGDNLMMMRYLPLLKERGAQRIHVLGPSFLNRVVDNSGCVDGIGNQLDPAAYPAFDYHCSLMSMPAMFGTTLDTIPRNVPYIRPDDASVARWRERVQAQDGMKIGLVWSGNPQFQHDYKRSVTLGMLGPLFGVPGTRFFSLQKGGGPAIAAANLPLTDWIEECGDVYETAALMACMDLVITVDTSMAHLAGAMGKRVWMMSRFESEWRWMRGREDSPWYPSMRIFPQQAAGEWAPVVQAMAAALAAE
ncbi:tetratricopeptide repeat protein [Noviherbaspirillum galbum]|uniref:Tetratricopeptide repeat protein n=1 Tax=Noviherbaspirillum galbum TaxID=2709383 RepID=A0A6B3SNK0_9BURK|nr:tetratricopeptide repeat-containing glycosyltransferase family protein [Noviherbaspirillum galbum]NEX60022.1 tetratricopeptide repeat protein [Noviherbaspirillum galbum]